MEFVVKEGEREKEEEVEEEEEEEEEEEGEPVVLVGVEAKWRGQLFHFADIDINSACVRDIKLFVSEETGIPSKRIKLLGPFGAAGTSENDVVMLNQFEKKLKKNQTFVVTVMGTPDAELTAFEQGSSNQAGEGVLNDFGHNFAPASKEWQNLKRFTDSCDLNFINEPRPGKKLLVLDLDHTILDFSNRESVTPEQMKRPYMDYFLETMYESYDIGIWSQTHWKWVEIKLIELGIINNPRFHLCFMLDKSCMFRSGSKDEYIKPLHIIWSKFPKIWGRHNTLHIDDLTRNFAMNPENGITCSAFYRHDNHKKKKRKASSSSSSSEASAPPTPDNELVLLTRYLISMAGLSDVSKPPGRGGHACWRLQAEALIQRGGECSSQEGKGVKKAS